MSRLIIVYAHGGKKKDPGAVNGTMTPNITEYGWSKEFIDKFVIPELKARKIEYVTIEESDWIHIDKEVNAIYQTGDIAVSCHLNASASEQSNGTEAFYCLGSKNGERLAKGFNEAICKVLGTKNRGIKGIQWDRVKPRVHDDRGGRLVCGTKPPVALLELFFISNPNEVKSATANRKELAKAYVDAYVAFRAGK